MKHKLTVLSFIAMIFLLRDSFLPLGVANSLEPIASLNHGGMTGILSIAFSPNGEEIVTSYENWLKFWNAQTYEKTDFINFDFEGIGRPQKVAYSPSGRIIAVALEDGSCAIYDLTTKQVVVKLGEASPFGYNQPIVNIKFIDAMRVIISRQVASELYETIIFGFSTQAGVVTGAKIIDGRFIGLTTDKQTMLISNDGEIAQMINVNSGDVIQSCSEIKRPIAFTDGIIVTDYGQMIHPTVWDLSSGTKFEMVTPEIKPVQDCAISPDENFVLIAYFDGKARLFDTISKEIVLEVETSFSLSSKVAFSPSGKEIFFGSSGTFDIYDISNLTPTPTLEPVAPTATPTPTQTPMVPAEPTPKKEVPNVIIYPTPTDDDIVHIVYEFQYTSSLETDGWIETYGGFSGHDAGEIYFTPLDLTFSEFSAKTNRVNNLVNTASVNEESIGQNDPLIPSSVDNAGLAFVVSATQVSFIQALSPVKFSKDTTIIISAKLRVTTPHVQISLLGLKGNLNTGADGLDGSISLRQTMNAGSFVNQEGTLYSIYQPLPDETNVTPAIQVAALNNQSAIVFVDRIDIKVVPTKDLLY